MSFFKEFKDDLSQAVNELLPGEEELKAATPEQPDLVVNTLEQEVDVQSELKKLEGLFEKVDETAARRAEKPVVPAVEKHVEEPKPTIQEAIQEKQKETVKQKPAAAEKPEHKEETIVSTEAVKEENVVNEGTGAEEVIAETKGIGTLSDEVSDEVTVITEGTSLKGDLESIGSFELRGKIDGNVRCNGKVTITGSLQGNAEASEFFADAAKVEGEISTTGTVKIGLGSVVVGNITASSAVIAGAIKGDIDVQGPVVVDTSAVVMGNIKSRSVQINNGAVIEGFCSQCYADVDMETFFEKK
ncbi:polymer-forming cytoskeletal protein [Lachnospiraceae bacterium KK002]